MDGDALVGEDNATDDGEELGRSEAGEDNSTDEGVGAEDAGEDNSTDDAE